MSGQIVTVRIVDGAITASIDDIDAGLLQFDPEEPIADQIKEAVVMACGTEALRALNGLYLNILVEQPDVTVGLFEVQRLGNLLHVPRFIANVSYGA